MTITLKPCPFCGGEATPKLAPYIGGGGCGYIIDCDKCWSSTGYYRQRDQAIAAWNTRAERTCHIKEDETGYLVCSECGAIQPDDYTVYYCWSCGAKVVEE